MSKQEYIDIIDRHLGTDWDERVGQQIPTTEEVKLKDGAVQLDAAFMYADLAGTSKMARVCPWGTTAKVIRAYLECALRIIKDHEGEIRSFDGDRVMGVFHGESKVTNAVRAARKLDWVIWKQLDPKARSHFKSIRHNFKRITHGVGVDVGTVRAVRSGIRNTNDLIWIGRPPSMAAKLSDVRDYPFTVYISDDAYNQMSKSLKTSKNGWSIWDTEDFRWGNAFYEVRKTKRTLEP